MKAFMDNTSKRHYMELRLTSEEIDKLPNSGISAKFFYNDVSNDSKKMLDILIVPETLSGFIPDNEWESEEEISGDYF